MGLESKGAPNSQDRMLRNACFLSHETAAPVRTSPRRALQRLSEDLLDLLVVDASRSAAAGCICQRINSPWHNGCATCQPWAKRLFRAGRSRCYSIPPEAPRMILARSASRWLDLLRFAIKVSFSLSAGLRTIVATGLPIGIALCKRQRPFTRSIFASRAAFFLRSPPTPPDSRQTKN